MDSKFLELWGNIFLSAAKGQQQIEDFNQWIQQGFKGYQQFGTLLAKIYGMEEKPAREEMAGDAWDKAVRSFQKSYEEYMSLMGMVPGEDYRRLATQYERLKEKAAEQEKTISRLRNAAGWENASQGEVVKGMKDLMTSQTEQFKELMKSFGSGFEGGQPQKDEKPRERKRKTGRGKTHDEKGS